MTNGKNYELYPLPDKKVTARELYTEVYASTKRGVYGRPGRRYGIFTDILKNIPGGFNPFGATYLDVGCGRGAGLDAAKDLFLETKGCDIVPFLAEADPRIDLIDTAARLPYGDDEFDVVSMIDVIEHLQPEGEWEDAIDECLRVCEVCAIFSVHTGLDGWGPALGVGPLHINVKPREFWEQWFIEEFGNSCSFTMDKDNPINIWVTVWKGAPATGKE